MKPFIKWIGGKTQIIDDVLSKFPTEIINYHEPFLGGGSVLLSLLENKDITIRGGIYAYDVNESLIAVYKNVQKSPTRLFNEIEKIVKEYALCTGSVVNRKPLTIEDAKTSRESYYYWIRKCYNSTKHTLKKSAMFIFLNKMCFRGMYREGPNGFNVPYGNYKTLNVVNKEELLKTSALLKPVIFKCCDFSKSMANLTQGDFVYLDPPYAPKDATSFVGYVKGGFDLSHHNKLFDIVNNLHCLFLLSNSSVPLVHDAFPSSKYSVTIISCRRAINSKNPGSRTDEVLISNELTL